MELSELMREVDEISEILKSNNADLPKPGIAPRSQVWRAVKQALLERALRHLALTDELTSLFNRRGFFAAATQMLKMAIRNRRNLLRLFCHVDNLIRFSETCGQQGNDWALVRTADALTRSSPGADVLARTDEEQFAVVAAEASACGGNL